MANAQYVALYCAMCIRGSTLLYGQKCPLDIEKCTPFFKIAFQAILDQKILPLKMGIILTTQYIFVNG
jgi:hypothetical protein